MNSKSKKIIFFTRYNNMSASVRYRYLQYFNILNKNNFTTELSYLFDNSFFNNKIILNKINIITILFSYIKRFFKLILIKNDTVVVVHLELFPYFPSIGERILNFKNIKIVIDLDDAIFHQYTGLNNYFLRILLKNKFKNIFNLKNSMITSGNEYNQKKALELNPKLKTKIFPTVVKVNNINQQKFVKKNKFTIVWIGSPSTSVYLKKILAPLAILNSEYNINIRLIGAGHIDLPGVQFESYRWNEETEIKLISECHVGIMPLNNDDWSKGKCGFKLLQYMSCKLPCVASPVGVNSDIIENNVNGFLVNSDNEWIKSILELKNNHSLYKKFYELSFIKLNEYYSYESQKKRILKYYDQFRINN